MRPVMTLLTAFAAGHALAQVPVVAGVYDSPLGRLRLKGDGATFVGTLEAPSGPCAFMVGDEVVRGTLLDDSLAGKVRLCLRGEGCEAEVWAPAVLLVGATSLSGAAHVKAGCEAPVGKKGGLTFVRAPPAPKTGELPRRDPAAPRPSATARRQARTIMRDGAAYLTEGYFERARKRFLEAIELDPHIPEAFNGVGVTYRMRNDLGTALAWYKKALAVDPDFGDAYYNMACVYALKGATDLALRYLQIAAVNGYATATGMGEDPDLASLHEEPAFKALLKVNM
jgi:TPR repeat